MRNSWPIKFMGNKNKPTLFHRNFMAPNEGMKFHFARFMGHEKIFMAFAGDSHGIFIYPCFVVKNPFDFPPKDCALPV